MFPGLILGTTQIHIHYSAQKTHLLSLLQQMKLLKTDTKIAATQGPLVPRGL